MPLRPGDGSLVFLEKLWVIGAFYARDRAGTDGSWHGLSACEGIVDGFARSYGAAHSDRSRVYGRAEARLARSCNPPGQDAWRVCYEHGKT